MIVNNAALLMIFYLETLSSFSSCIIHVTHLHSSAPLSRPLETDINNVDDEV